MKLILWLLLDISVFALFFYNAYNKGLDYILKTFLELAILIFISFIFFFLIPREKAIKISQYAGFGCFFLWLFFNNYYLFLTGIFGITQSIFLKKGRSSKKGGKTLNEKIKNQLSITVKSMKMNLPKRIGGFVIPSLPFFHVVSKKWKGNFKKEAIIHENVHLYYLQNGWLVAIVIGILLIAALVQKIAPESFDISLFILILFIFSAVFFEYITFNKTHKIGEAMGIVTRQWNKNIAFRYLWIYTLQFIIAFFIYHGIKFIVTIVKGLL